MATCPRGYWRSSAPARVIGMDHPGDGLDGVLVNGRDPVAVDRARARARLQETRRREKQERQREAARDGLGSTSAARFSGGSRSC